MSSMRSMPKDQARVARLERCECLMRTALRIAPTPGSCARSAGSLTLFLAGRLLHSSLHLFEGANLDLANAFTRDAELGGEVLQGRGLFGEPPCLENALLA